MKPSVRKPVGAASFEYAWLKTTKQSKAIVPSYKLPETILILEHYVKVGRVL